jgi:uncharacterized membrane-anchored protein
MKDRKLLKYIAASVVPLIVLIGMTILPLFTLLFGKEIALETQPVDPRDVFMGDYVNLSYKIESVETDKLPQEIKDTKKNYEYYDYDYYNLSSIRGKDVYAVLKPQGAYYVVDYLTLQKPQSDISLKCSIISGYALKDNETGKSFLRVKYNLDKYYVAEGSGGELERASRKGELAANIKVFNGYAVLKGLSIK